LDEESEELTEMLVEIVAALDETVTERDLYKKMYQQEKEAKEAIAQELNSALLKISRLTYYLENT
jgi:hypothetical protein